MQSSNPDTVWINLKVLGKLPPYYRLNTQYELFYIEKKTFWNPVYLWRFIRGDNRQEAIRRIDELVEKAHFILTTDKQCDGERMCEHLKLAKMGLANMKKTYECDITINATIDRILDKINKVLEESDEKFKECSD